MSLASCAYARTYLFNELVSVLEIYRGRFGEVPLDSRPGAPLRQTFLFPGTVAFPFPVQLLSSYLDVFLQYIPTADKHGQMLRQGGWLSPLLQLLCGQHLGTFPCRLCPASLVATVSLGFKYRQSWQGIQRWPHRTSAC